MPKRIYRLKDLKRYPCPHCGCVPWRRTWRANKGWMAYVWHGGEAQKDGYSFTHDVEVEIDPQPTSTAAVDKAVRAWIEGTGRKVEG